MATLKQTEEFLKRKREGLVGLETLKKRNKQRIKNSKLVGEIASLAIPGLGAAKIGRALMTRGPNFVKSVRSALNSKDNKDALRLAFGLDKKVGGKTKTKIIKGADGKTKTVVQKTPDNLVKSRFGKGGARPISKAAKEKAKKARTAAAVVGTVAAGSIMGSDSKKSTPKKTTPKKTKPIKKPTSISPPKKTKPKKDPTEGGRFAFYPGQTSKDLGLMYEVDKNKMPDEIRERLEEAELYEGDFKGGRVGKGKKKKVSEAPRGVRAAMRGFKTMKISGKVGRQSKGKTNRWV